MGLGSTQNSAPTIQTIDLAAELMAMTSAGVPVCSQGQVSEVGPKRPRDEMDVAHQQDVKKPPRKFRPLPAHDAALFATPAHIKVEDSKQTRFMGAAPTMQVCGLPGSRPMLPPS